MIYHHLKRILTQDPNVIIEIGAHTGTDTRKILTIAQKRTEFVYYAFEPDQRNYKVLMARFFPEIKILPFAVSNREGECSFYRCYGNGRTDLSSLMQPKDTLRRNRGIKFEQDTIQCVTLDKFKLPHVTFIWMDVQGAELLVLQGARQTLRQTDYVYMECEERIEAYEGRPTLRDIRSELVGWDIVFRTQTDVLFKRGSK